MTTVFTFTDGISIVADSKKEAIETRKEGLEELDEAEKQELLSVLKAKVTEEEVQDFFDLDNLYGAVEQDTAKTVAGHPHMLETYGEDLEKAKITDDNHIWTIVNTDNDLMQICPGFHLVNRIGYLQTHKPWTSQDLSYLW
jgi:hypothetical protein